MAKQRRQPRAVVVAEGLTSFWCVVVAILVVVPRVFGSPMPLAAGTVAVLALGGVVVVGAWVWMIRTLRAPGASGTSLAALRAMTPTAFEEWVGDRFRERGYAVEVTGAQGDHGIDLCLKKPGEIAVVQVKKFVTRTVGEPVLRDLYGAMHAAGATRAYLVTTGALTPPARRWVAALAGRPVEVWEAETVARLATAPAPTPGDDKVAFAVADVVPAPLTGGTAATTGSPMGMGVGPDHPRCPQCGAPMLTRRNGTTGASFFGCSTFPRCRGTRPLRA